MTKKPVQGKAQKTTAGCTSEEDDIAPFWEIPKVIAERIDCQTWAVSNTVELLENDNTIPFIARYRKEQTNNMEADKIRELKENLDELKTVQAKIKTAASNIKKAGKLTKQLVTALQSSQTILEVDHLYAPFKPGSKRSLAERAKELGLEQTANNVLSCPNSVNLQLLIKPETKGLSTLSDVESGVQHIIADVIAKDTDSMNYVRELCRRSNVTVECSKAKTTTTKKEGIDQEKVESLSGKFENYFNFHKPVKFMQPHQTLAINRGEHLKILCMKINIPDQVKTDFLHFSKRKWIPFGTNLHYMTFLENCILDAYTRLIQPLMIRQIRSTLTKEAEKASVDVFASNLKRLLLTPPIRGKIVLALDPGFRNGCKFSVISHTGKVLETGVAYLHDYKSNKMAETSKVKQALLRNRCETVTIGNGQGCRETESWLAEHIERQTFHPLNVVYCITSEAGASIYSASDLAKTELPDLDISLRGAVSIGRRLQDPMAELVKIEPKHIGVGMYQHDISENLLKTALEGVVEDCVSFVGVDINTCSEVLLRKVSGLGSSKAKKIISWIEANGAFINRSQLKSVKGLGPKTYEQCIGFVRILPSTRGRAVKSEIPPEEEPGPSEVKGRKRKVPTKTSAKSKKAKLELGPNNLDMTSIHPESYPATEMLMKEIGVDAQDIGEPPFIAAVKNFLSKTNFSNLAKEFAVGEPTMTLIIDGLQQPIGYDIREEFEKPLFKQGLKCLQDLNHGEVLTGQVNNVTHFGAFVDVGVSINGLIHTSQMRPSEMRGKRALEVGDKIECIVQNVDQQKNRLGLRLSKLLSTR